MYAKLVTLKAGYKFDKEKVAEHLTLNEYYLITEIYMENSHTTVILKDLGSFNSVFFEFYDESKNLLSEDIYSKQLNYLTTHDY